MSAMRDYIGQAYDFPREDWIRRFKREGFTVDGARAERPTQPLTLYRGAARGDGMSWTTSRVLAQRWASRPYSELWTIRRCPPSAMLAMAGSEVVVDTSYPGVRVLACPATMTENHDRRRQRTRETLARMRADSQRETARRERVRQIQRRWREAAR